MGGCCCPPETVMVGDSLGSSVVAAVSWAADESVRVCDSSITKADVVESGSGPGFEDPDSEREAPAGTWREVEPNDIRVVVPEN